VIWIVVSYAVGSPVEEQPGEFGTAFYARFMKGCAAVLVPHIHISAPFDKQANNVVTAVKARLMEVDRNSSGFIFAKIVHFVSS